MASPIIELRNIEMCFGTTQLFSNVNLKVYEGESLVLVGPSGHGKSVLLKIMCGLIKPTNGEVYIRGTDFIHINDMERYNLMRTMGVLFQKNALFDSLTVSENIAFPLHETTKKSNEEVEKIIADFLRAVDLSEAKDLFPDEISGGMQKRLGIARALALQPKIVFYDDPTAGLDPITSRVIVKLILNLKKVYNSTVVAITNDMNRAYQMADKIGMIVEGEFILTGSIQETKDHIDPRIHQFINGEIQGPLTDADG